MKKPRPRAGTSAGKLTARAPQAWGLHPYPKERSWARPDCPYSKTQGREGYFKSKAKKSLEVRQLLHKKLSARFWDMTLREELGAPGSLQPGPEARAQHWQEADQLLQGTEVPGNAEAGLSHRFLGPNGHLIPRPKYARFKNRTWEWTHPPCFCHHNATHCTAFPPFIKPHRLFPFSYFLSRHFKIQLWDILLLCHRMLRLC